MIHHLKCVNPYFEDVLEGTKTFEVRKNDRKFKVGDLIALREYDPEKEEILERSVIIKIDYIYKGKIGLNKGYVILGITNFDIIDI